jgi:PhnB protein
MTTTLNPYLGFRDNARQAMEFYQSVFGGELTLSTFADFQASEDPAEQATTTRSPSAATTRPS